MSSEFFSALDLLNLIERHASADENERFKRCLRNKTLAEAVCRVFVPFNPVLRKYAVSDEHRHNIFENIPHEFDYHFKPVFRLSDGSSFMLKDGQKPICFTNPDQN